MSTKEIPACPECWEADKVIKNGTKWNVQKFKCKMCWNNYSTASIVTDKVIAARKEKEAQENNTLKEQDKIEAEVEIEKKIETESQVQEDIIKKEEKKVKPEKTIEEKMKKQLEKKKDSKTKKPLKWAMSKLERYENFKEHYWDVFPEPRFSKRYWFYFTSWQEYFSIRAKSKDSKKKKVISSEEVTKWIHFETDVLLHWLDQ